MKTQVRFIPPTKAANEDERIGYTIVSGESVAFVKSAFNAFSDRQIFVVGKQWIIPQDVPYPLRYSAPNHFPGAVLLALIIRGMEGILSEYYQFVHL